MVPESHPLKARKVAPNSYGELGSKGCPRSSDRRDESASLAEHEGGSVKSARTPDTH